MIRPQELDDPRMQPRPNLLPRPASIAEAARNHSSSHALGRLIQILADEARATAPAHHALLCVSLDEDWGHVVTALSLSDKYAGWKPASAPADDDGLHSLVCPVLRPMRLTQSEVRAHPAWNRVAANGNHRPPLRGWLAVPLINQRGQTFGMIELTDRTEGDFTADDELRLIQFSKSAAAAVENVRLQASPPVASAPSGMDRRRRPPESLAVEIGKLLDAGGELPGVLQGCADAFAQHTGVALARIWIFQGGVMTLQASAGRVIPQDDIRTRVPVGQFSAGHIARSRRPLVANSILDHPHIHDKEWSRREGMTAFAGCPLLVDNELVGVIAMFDSKPILAPTFGAMTSSARELGVYVKRHRVEELDETPAPAPVRPPDAAPRAEHAVIVTTRDGTIVDWNRGAEKCFGFARSEAVGRPLDIVVPGDRMPEHHDFLQRIARGEPGFYPETSRQQKSGRCIDVRLTAVPLRDDAGAVVGAITIVHDLADVKLLQQQNCAAQKMEVFGQLTGGVAHDFNNLLTVILGYSEIVMGRLGAGDPVRDLLAEIQKAGQRAETLTRQLLSFSRKKMFEPKVLDLNAVVSDTEKMLRRLIGEDILMTTLFAPKLNAIKVDPGQMQQVILNLAVNARDAMPRGGRLTVETANVRLDDSYAQTHPDVVPGEYVVFALSDTGSGMSPATLARIFEPLFTTKGPGKGTGLGLKTVLAIVKQYGGHIEVFSEVNRGSTFRVYLPRADDNFAAVKSHPQLRTIPRGCETILLVEDEDSVRNLAGHVLELNGYRIIEARHGEEALRLAENHASPIHLLISDVVMPHLGGRPLADHLLRVRPGLRVLFLSGYTDDAIDRHGVLDSQHAFLQKPFTTAALAQKVRDVLDQPLLDP